VSDELHVSLVQTAAGGALDDVERIASLTEKDRRLNSFAFRSFRDVADADYIMARMAYRAQLPAQFFWASQQAIEKYLKCILFIRRVPAKHLWHDLAAGLRLVEASQIPLQLTDRTRKFIKRVDEVGRFRYMEVSLFVDWHWIVALDQSVWELRRFATLDPKATSATLVEGKWAPRVSIVGGHLEGVLKNRTNPARPLLLWHNGYFGRGRRTVTVRGGFRSVNSPLFNWPDLLDEVLQYIYLPKDVAHAYRELSKQKVAKRKL
jgi:hypothetical protein